SVATRPRMRPNVEEGRRGCVPSGVTERERAPHIRRSTSPEIRRRVRDLAAAALNSRAFTSAQNTPKSGNQWKPTCSLHACPRGFGAFAFSAENAPRPPSRRRAQGCEKSAFRYHVSNQQIGRATRRESGKITGSKPVVH